MKLLLMLIVAAAMTLAAYPAFATITTTPHDYQGNSGYGMCGTCHVPHAAVAGMGRLWRTGAAGGGTAWQTSKVGKLCNTCHNGSPTITGANRYTCNPVSMAGLAYAATSHRRSMTVLNTDLGGPAGPVGALPYTDAGGSIECPSCHNPHDDGLNGDPGIRPFLRGTASISAFCAQCHGDRYNNGLIGTANTSGNHPVNIVYADGYSVATGSGHIQLRNGAGGRPVVAAAMAVGVAATGAATDTWPLGGKFQSDVGGTPIVGASPQGGNATDYIGCQTCHSVHKQAGDSNFLLTIRNTGADTFVNGLGDTVGYSALCEGCHGGPSNAINAVGDHVGASGDRDHPIDALMTGSPNTDRWTASSGSEPQMQERPGPSATNIWPKAASAGVNIMCTSCHSAHKATVYAAGNITHRGKLTRHGNNSNQSNIDFCLSCHESLSPLGHHSNSSNTGTIGGTVYSPTASTVTCTGATGCHGGGSGNSGFDFYTLSGDNTVLCKSCHVTSGTDPVNNVLDGTITSTYATLPGDGTALAGHLGNTAVPGATSHTLVTFSDGSNGINAKTADWGVASVNVRTTPNSAGAPANPNNSKYGASGNKLICESCHSVLGNIGTASGTADLTTGWKNNLLLGNYKDDSDNQANSRLVGSGFCVACHNSGAQNATYNLGGTAGIPSDTAITDSAATPSGQFGMHPMTNWSISKAKDVNRETNGASATNKLITGPDATSVALYGSYADAGTAPPDSGGGVGTDSTVSYPGTNAMDCDSCHRPHLAPDNATFDKVMGGTKTAPVIVEINAAANEFSDLCQACHNY